MISARAILRVLTLLATAACAESQALDVAEDHQNPPVLSERRAEIDYQPPSGEVQPTVRAGFFQRYTKLRRGRDQEIGVFLCRPTPKLPDCVLHLVSIEKQPLPVLLEIDPANGFTIRYGDGRHYKARQPGQPYNLADRRVVFFKLHASNKLPPGEYILKGSLTFRISGVAAASEPQRVPVEIPVSVVAHDANVSGLEWPYGSHPGQSFKNVLTGFVAVPFWTGVLAYAAVYCAFADCK